MIEPFCGRFDESVDSTWDKLKDLFGIVSITTFLIWAFQKWKDKGAVKEVFEEVIKFFGVEAAGGFWIAAIIAYLVSVYILFRVWYDDCVADPKGERRCLSGVVEEIHDDEVDFLFNAKHPSIDVVIKSAYWALIALGADRVYCSGVDGSMLRVFYKSSRICGAKLGALVGGAIAGVGGVIAAAAIGAAIGCATVILCIVALIVAALIVIAAVAAGAAAGGAIGAAASEDNVPEYEEGMAIAVTDLVSVQGPLVKRGDSDGAIVMYFEEDTWLLGDAPRGPSYSNNDADEFIPDEDEACEIPRDPEP